MVFNPNQFGDIARGGSNISVGTTQSVRSQAGQVNHGGTVRNSNGGDFSAGPVSRTGDRISVGGLVDITPDSVRVGDMALPRGPGAGPAALAHIEAKSGMRLPVSGGGAVRAGDGRPGLAFGPRASAGPGRAGSMERGADGADGASIPGWEIQNGQIISQPSFSGFIESASSPGDGLSEFGTINRGAGTAGQDGARGQDSRGKDGGVSAYGPWGNWDWG